MLTQVKNMATKLLFFVLAIIICAAGFNNVYAATVIPIVNKDKDTNQTEEKQIIIDDDVIQMVLIKTAIAYSEPSENSKKILSVTGGKVVSADFNSLGNEFITVEYNGIICYIKSENLKVIIGLNETTIAKINEIYESCKYQAEDVVEIIKAPKYYSVNGATLYYNYQDFIWTLCVNWEIEKYFPTLLCQFYQESRYNQNAVSYTNDHGICQLNERYHDGFTQQAGHPEWNVKTDPYANMYCGVMIMARNIKNRNGNIDIAMTDYNAGGGYYGKYGIRYQYTNAVHNWEKTLKEIRNETP